MLAFSPEYFTGFSMFSWKAYVARRVSTDQGFWASRLERPLHATRAIVYRRAGIIQRCPATMPFLFLALNGPRVVTPLPCGTRSNFAKNGNWGYGAEATAHDRTVRPGVGSSRLGVRSWGGRVVLSAGLVPRAARRGAAPASRGSRVLAVRPVAERMAERRSTTTLFILLTTEHGRLYARATHYPRLMILSQFKAKGRTPRRKSTRRVTPKASTSRGAARS